MCSEPSISPQKTGLAALPLAVAYAAVPLGMASVALTGGTAVVPFLPWLLLAGIGLLRELYAPAGVTRPKGRFAFSVVLFALLVAGLFLYTPDILQLTAPYLSILRELIPLPLLLLSLLWVRTCGLPDRADFQRFGGLLGFFCLIDLIAELAVYGVVPTVRWLGNADMLAGLLLVAMCAGLRPGENEGGMVEPDQGRPIWRVLTVLGLMACLSRSGLFGAAWVLLCFGRGSILVRTSQALVCILLLGGSFFIPPTSSDAVRFLDYWLWVESLRQFILDPMMLLSGFSLTDPLPLVLPSNMNFVWEAATGTSALQGILLPYVTSFWLRLTLGFGIFAPLGICVLLFILLLKRLNRMGAGLVAALFAQGMTTPLVFDPAMGVTIFLGFMVAFTPQPDAVLLLVNEDGEERLPVITPE